MSQFEIYDVADWPIMAEEPGGDDDKDWIAEPATAPESRRSDWWLFKPAKYGPITLPGGGPGGSYRRRDDQVEKIASELSKLIGLPAARVEVALRSGEEGIISGNVTPAGWDLQPGNTYLSEFPDYLNCDTDPEPRPPNRIGHNLDNISQLLTGVKGPPNTGVGAWAAMDVFAGYLVFDAWIANTDRHALNWGLLDRGGERCLAKSYDHGSSLASGVNEADLPKILSNGIEAWAGRAKAHRFENGRKFTLLDVALEGLELASDRASVWLDRIQSLERPAWVAVIDAVPSMSEVARTFTDELLTANRKRLRDGYKRSE